MVHLVIIIDLIPHLGVGLLLLANANGLHNRATRSHFTDPFYRQIENKSRIYASAAARTDLN